jgi:hypothetical protein
MILQNPIVARLVVPLVVESHDLSYMILHDHATSRRFARLVVPLVLQYRAIIWPSKILRWTNKSHDAWRLVAQQSPTYARQATTGSIVPRILNIQRNLPATKTGGTTTQKSCDGRRVVARPFYDFQQFKTHRGRKLSDLVVSPSVTGPLDWNDDWNNCSTKTEIKYHSFMFT